jgi:hypothetical protein
MKNEFAWDNFGIQRTVYPAGRSVGSSEVMMGTAAAVAAASDDSVFHCFLE